MDHHRTVDACLIFDTTSITPRSLRLRGFFVAAHGFHTGVPFALKACAELFQNHVSIFCLPCLPCRPCALRAHQNQRSRKQVSFREREGYATEFCCGAPTTRVVPVRFALTVFTPLASWAAVVSAKGASGLKGTSSAQSGSKQLWENLGTLRTARDRPPHPSPITSRYLPLPPAGRENLQPQIRQAPSKTPLSWREKQL